VEHGGTAAGAGGRFTLIVPAKALAVAKSRLGLPDSERRSVAAWLLDRTIGVALASRRVAEVVVVTGDVALAAQARLAGCTVVAEPVPHDLNRAVRLARKTALTDSPDRAVAILVADLPSLAVEDLEGALDEFDRLSDGPAGDRAALVVADHLGTGTTMLVHARSCRPLVLFGPGSAQAHVSAGYRPAEGRLGSLRRDLDTADDLDLLVGAGGWDGLAAISSRRGTT